MEKFFSPSLVTLPELNSNETLLMMRNLLDIVPAVFSRLSSWFGGLVCVALGITISCPGSGNVLVHMEGQSKALSGVPYSS